MFADKSMLGFALIAVLVCGLSCQSGRTPAAAPKTRTTQSAPSSASRPTTASAPAGLTEAIGQAALEWFDRALGDKLVEKMVPAAEKAAERFIAGGNLYVAGNRGFCDEMVGRAGGFPFTAYMVNSMADAGSVVLVGLYRPDGSDSDNDLLNPSLRKELCGNALVVLVASHDWPHVKAPAARAATRPDDNLALVNTGTPRGDSMTALCLGQLATTALAWAFQGEVMSAATRKGKTLATFASDWEPGGPEWDDTVRHEHLHPTYRVPPIPAGKLGNDYLRVCRKQVAEFITTQAGQVRLAAARMAQSMRRGGTVWVITNSHIHTNGSEVPAQLTGVSVRGREHSFYSTVSGMQGPDVLLWLGYLRYPADEVDQALAKGDVIVLAADDGPKDAGPPTPSAASGGPARRVNIRACWQDYDTVIDLPKYPIRVLPSTGTCACPQWYCLMAETLALYKPSR